MRRGEVWWVEAPDIGRRPHLVLTRDAAIGALHTVLAVPATRTIRGIPTEVELGRDEGMSEPCVLSLDNVAVVEQGFFVERITMLGEETLRRVCRALGHATGCEV